MALHIKEQIYYVKYVSIWLAKKEVEKPWLQEGKHIPLITWNSIDK